MSMLNEPQNVQELNKLASKILLSETPGVRKGTLVDAHHFVDGDDIVSLIIYDKEPTMQDGALQHERRWALVVSLKDDGQDSQSWSKTRGIVSVWWEDEEESDAED